MSSPTLGGSRATLASHPDSDWDFGLYYGGRIHADDVRALGFVGEVVEPGSWGRLVNGGAWLVVEGQRVDLLYREIGFVDHWLEETKRGYFEVDRVEGFVTGMPTYVLAGELALCKMLSGQLPRPSFPEALRRSAPPWWLASASFSLVNADAAAVTADRVLTAGLLAKAAIAVAQACLAERGEWALNEKRIVQRAGLAETELVLAAIGESPVELRRSVGRMREVLHVAPPKGMKLDQPG